MDSKTCSDGNQKPGPQTSLESAELLCHQTKPNESCKSSRFTRVDGPWSWIVVVFLLFCILFQYGCTSTYGILFPDILRGLKSSRALAAIPGSAAVSNTGILGIFIGKLCDQFGSRKILFTGSILSSVGMVSSSYAPNIGVLIGTFGFLLGTGSCMVYFSAMMAIPLYFDKYKFEAFSIVSSGLGSSLLLMTPNVRNLNQSLDWRKTVLVMSAFSVAPFVVSFVMRSANPNNSLTADEEVENRSEERSCQAVDFCYFSALKIKGFLLATITTAVSFLGHGMPFVHLAKLSEDIGIESKPSSLLYFIIGFSSTASRLVVAKFGKNGPLSLPIICLLGNILLALGNLILPSTSVFHALVLYSIGYGVGEGLLITPALNIVLESIPNEKRGSGYGLFMFIISSTYVIASVLSGYIADVSGSYKTAFYLAGSLEVFGGCLCCLFRFIKSSDKHPINQPINQPSNQPSNQPIIKQPTNLPTNQSPTNQAANHPTKRPTNQPTNQPTHQPGNQPSNPPSNPPTNLQPTHQPTNQSTNQPTYNRPTNQTTDQTTNQQTN